MDKIKAGLAAIFAVLSARLGILAVPVYLLVLSSLADYVTGMMASVYRKEAVSSYRSIRGKKTEAFADRWFRVNEFILSSDSEPKNITGSAWSERSVQWPAGKIRKHPPGAPQARIPHSR